MRARPSHLIVVLGAALLVAGQVTPALAEVASPAVGPVSVVGRAPGNVVRATGTGFDADAAVTISLVGAGGSVVVTTAGADDAGTVTIPPDTRLPVSAAPGSYRLTMAETDGPSATSAPFVLVAPTVVFPDSPRAGQPASQYPFTTIQLQGLTDGPGVDRTVTLDGLRVDTDWTGSPGAIRSSNLGFAVPADTRVGDHRLTFTQTGPTPYTVSGTVHLFAPSLSVQGSPTSSGGRLGVTVYYAGWNDVVDVRVTGAAGDSRVAAQLVGTGTTLSGPVDLQGLSAGTATLTAVSRHNGATATATFTVDPTTIAAPAGLAPGARVVSADGVIELRMQTDGNLVLSQYGTVFWSSRTAGRSARLVVQSDGNVVIRATDGRALWSTGTSGIGAGARFGLAADGNPVVSTASGRTAWSGFAFGGSVLDRLTAGRYLFKNQLLWGPDVTMTLGGDGNVVLRQLGGPALWSTRTAGHANAYLVLQTDGNLVLRSVSGSVLWANGVRGAAGASVVTQRDGNVVEYAANGRALWSTRTHIG